MAKSVPTLNNVLKETVDRVANKNIASGTSEGSNFRIALANTPLFNSKYAQTVSNINVAGPNFFTPFTTPQAFQIPNNRKEVYLWAEWWKDNDAKVAAAIEFYTDFPVSDYELECPNGYVKDYFSKLIKKLNFDRLLPQISQEYHLRGDVFCLASIECERCDGLNIDKETGEPCEHLGASWKNISIINPETVEVTPHFLDRDPSYTLVITDDMAKVVQEKKPKEIYDNIPDEIKKAILKKEPILLSPECIYHFKRGSSPWQPYGMSMIRRLFTIMAYKEKLRQAQWLVAERHIIPVKVVKIGSEDRPASDEDITNTQEILTNVANDPLLTLVTHHNFDFEYIGAEGKVLQVSNEFELIDQEVLDGLMLHKAFLNGEGPSYANAEVGLVAMNRRLEKLRKEISYWVEEKIFKPVSTWNGFTVEGKRGQQEYVYPKIKWGDMQLKDNTGKLQMMQTSQQNGVISAQTLIEAYGLDYDQEVERLRFEQSVNFISTPGQSILEQPGGMGGGYGGGLTPDLGMGMGAGVMPTDMGGGMGTMMGGPEMGVPLTPEMAPQGPGMAQSSNSKPDEQYRLAFNTMNDICGKIISDYNNGLNNRVAEKKVINDNHLSYLESLMPVTGRGKVGVIPEEPNVFFSDTWLYPINGGNFCAPLNIYAAKDYENIKLSAKDIKPMPRLFSKLEQSLYNIILSSNVPIPFYAQYQAGPGLQFQIDGAFPSVKLGIEADSHTFHSSPEKIEQDKQRDMTLATQGWTILRFTEEEIEQKPTEILNVVIKVLRKLLNQEQTTNVGGI